MATVAVTINIDNTLIPQAEAALAWKTGYQAQIPNPNGDGTMIANPVTLGQNAKQAIIAYVKNAILDYQNMQAQQAVVPPADNLIS
jgi:hypothetical protein